MTPDRLPAPPHAARVGLRSLARRDPLVGAIERRAGPLPWRRRARGFPGLLQAICGQQISNQAAAAIWRRLAVIPGAITPEGLLGLADDVLRTAGLSRPNGTKSGDALRKPPHCIAALPGGCGTRIPAASLWTPQGSRKQTRQPRPGCAWRFGMRPNCRTPPPAKQYWRSKPSMRRGVAGSGRRWEPARSPSFYLRCRAWLPWRSRRCPGRPFERSRRITPPVAGNVTAPQWNHWPIPALLAMHL